MIRLFAVVLFIGVIALGLFLMLGGDADFDADFDAPNIDGDAPSVDVDPGNLDIDPADPDEDPAGD